MQEKKLNVLSLFDGISCGCVALDRANIEIDNYYASEIDKYAIKISNKNYPNIIRLGDVTKWKVWNLPKIDLLIGGSPCTGFSKVGKGLNFEDPQSKLFFEYVNILNYYKPKYFLLENVKMKKEWQDIISDLLDVQPIKINSALVSAQNRERLYWTNIPNIKQPEDKYIYLKDILEETVDEEYYKIINDEDIIKGSTNNSNMEYIGAIETNKHKKRLSNGKTLSRNFSQGYRIYGENGKAQTLVSTGVGGLGGATGLYQVKGTALRNQIIKRGTESQLNIRKDEKSNCVVSSYSHKLNGIIIQSKSKSIRSGGRNSYDSHEWDSVDDTHYRKLSPVECERLQTLPDNYTKLGMENVCVKSVKSKIAKNQFPINQQDIVTNIILDLLGTEQQKRERLSIKAKNVLSINVKEKEKPLMICVSYTTSDLLELAQQKKYQENIKNVRFVVKQQLQKNYVEIIIITTAGMEIALTQKKLEIPQQNMDIKNQEENIEWSIEMSHLKFLEETLLQKILFIILILTNKIISQKIFLSQINQNISYCIDNLNISLQSCLSWDISNLKTETIFPISSTQRFKTIGNGWTIDVITHIFNYLPKEYFIDNN